MYKYIQRRKENMKAQTKAHAKYSRVGKLGKLLHQNSVMPVEDVSSLNKVHNNSDLFNVDTYKHEEKRGEMTHHNTRGVSDHK